MIFLILNILLTPPVVYVILFFILLSVLGSLYAKFQEQINPVIFAILDAIMVVVRAILSCLRAIWWCMQRTAYPIKERYFAVYDYFDEHFNPYKKKTPFTHIPTFSY